MGDLLSTSALCVETVSHRAKNGLFGGQKQEVRVTAVLTPRWLLWAIVADRPEPVVMSARFREFVVQDYAATKFAAMVPEQGLEVSGSITDAAECGATFIGPGPQPAVVEFREALIRAVQGADV